MGVVLTLQWGWADSGVLPGYSHNRRLYFAELAHQWAGEPCFVLGPGKAAVNRTDVKRNPLSIATKTALMMHF